jgi:RNA polymerase sigma-70 factor (sigma-E family)
MLTIADTGVAYMPTAAETRDADFTAYLHARQPGLLRTAYLLTGDRANAEDLLQTSLAKLYLAWDRVQRRDSVDAYLRRIMVNELNGQWRRPWRRREVVVEHVPESSGVHDEYDDGTGARLWSFVQTLPRKQRAVIVLRYYEQLSEAETAEVMGCSVGTVKSQASRALSALRARAPRSLDPRESPDPRPREEER